MPNLSPELAALAVPPKTIESRIPWWVQSFIILALTGLSFLIDKPVTAWMLEHPGFFWDIASTHKDARKGDIARDLMWIEQFGHFACTGVAVTLVFFLDPAGRRKALAIALACIAVLISTHLLKDTFGRSRPHVVVRDAALTRPAYNLKPGDSVWGGPAMGFTKGADWGSFPSAHTTAAFGLAAALSWFYPRARYLFFLIACGTGIQRLFHTAHFVSDIFFGIFIGVAVARLTLRLNPAGRLIAIAPAWSKRFWMKEFRS
jgi:membrane-associated phospholipid phosphatase